MKIQIHSFLKVTKLKKILSQVIQRGATGEESGEDEL